MNICLFSSDEIVQPLNLSDERAQHLIKILHKKTGDTFTAGIIGGQAGIATITEIQTSEDDKTQGQIFFNFEPKNDGKNLNPLKMIIGFPRPIQLKRLLRDIAALGVCEVHLTGTELGEKSYMQSTLVEKGNAYKMLLDGTVQAGSTHIPQLFMHKTLKDCLEYVVQKIPENSANTQKEDNQVLKLALDNVNPTMSLNAALHCSKLSETAIAAIGSERGWTDKERKLLEDAGFIRCGMGQRIMRTETAATVAGAIILNAYDCLS